MMYRNKKLTESARHEACVSCGANDGRVKIGDRFTRLLVVGLIPDRKNPKAICLCDCGKTITPQRGALKNSRAKSCGCLRRELLAMHVQKIKGTGVAQDEARIKANARAKIARDKNLEESRRKNRIATRKFYRAHPEKAKENCQKRRARKLNAIGKITKGIELLILKKQKNKCACCKVDLNNKWHLDHVVPLVNGGLHEDLNLQILCSFCNLSKGSKDPIQFMQSRGFLL
jgi:5-methylcytosine-specific restriction endonuclease McrA